MTNPFAPLGLFAPSALLALATPIAGDVGAPPPPPPPEIAQLTIHEHLIIRVPRLQQSMPAARMPIPVPPRWKEKKGPKCIAASDLAGAVISQPGSVDLILVGGDRIRAVLDDDCGPLDYYGGYYLRPASDGRICASRDVIRVRSGRSCPIAKFRKLVETR
ncbi:hypothetical protein [Sphingomonas oligophenolica]|uniref:Uncharacterized protein n=1 Tax=Sphingomonas oligophenolica TaxID=301154 RepID=A0A502CU04_9SPHN|nr:hypothetical protein [Sphingomonas oligophenolica]TPG15296.1 hypothetical protein EAH84_00240 [Sphingomonas oligophenolica]